MQSYVLVGKSYTEYFKRLKIRFESLQSHETIILHEKKLIITKVFDAFVVHWDHRSYGQEPSYSRTFINIDSLMKYIRATGFIR